MESNQYSDFGEGSGYAVERKTSVLAIVAFALTVICCLPVVAQIGLLLGVVAVAGIATSGGRKGGMGFGVAAIVLGLIGTLIWGGILLSVNFYAGMVDRVSSGTLEPAMTAIATDDWSNARAQFKPDAADLITDEALAEFAQAYADEFGTYQSYPDGFFEWAGSFDQVEPEFRSIQQLVGLWFPIFPVPVQNANGPSLVLAHAAADPDQLDGLVNLGVVIDGKVRWLIDPTTQEFRDLVRASGALPQDGGADAPNEDQEDPEGG